MSYRQERIERLLEELRYEVTRGMMEGEVDEHLGFRFSVPVSKSIPGGIVACRFETRPQLFPVIQDEAVPRLRVIK